MILTISKVKQIDQENSPPSDRGSINFLLNAGTASFIESFQFPSSNERRNLLALRNNESSSQGNINFLGNSSENGSTFANAFEEEPIDWSLFDDECLLRFLSSPFNDYQMQSDDIFAAIFMDANFSTPGPMTGIQLPREWEAASVQSAAIVQGILEKATSLNLTPEEHAEISQNLNYLFTPTKIDNLVNIYFETWHVNCPILHQPSFRIESVPPALLISVTLMGAMYSQVDREASTAKDLLDLSELFVYSTDDLTDDAEIRQMLRTPPGAIANYSTTTSSLTFQNLQAAYLMVCVQFWAGNIVARRRSIETRFGTVVKVGSLLFLNMSSRSECKRSSREDSVSRA